MKMEIPAQVEWILDELKAHGYEAFAVGGCVRDTLLGRTPGDWDITTSAKPEEVKAVFGRTIDTGLQHGTVTVMRDHVGYEITTYRLDGEYEDGRHPKAVTFTGELKEDLRRRDFTINAMAYSHGTGVVDIFHGVEDLEARLIRCVGEARERFTEDALRILRAIRFSAQLDFAIEESTWLALRELAPNLAHVSKERIQAELTKTLLSGHPERILMTEETGMVPYISPSFGAAFEENGREGLTQEGPALCERLRRSAKLPSQKALRWTAFLCGAGEEMAARILRELKLDNDTIGSVRLLTRWFYRSLPLEEGALRRVMGSMEDESFDMLLLLVEKLCPEKRDHVEAVRRTAAGIRERGDCIRLRQLAVTGKELMAAGIKPGPQLGEILGELLEHVMDHPEANERDTLMKYITFLKCQHNQL